MQHTTIDMGSLGILEKDLTDNECICSTCGGTGVVKSATEFYVSADGEHNFKAYTNEYLGPCPSCFNGVVKKCQYCGKPTKKGSINSCDCEQYLKELTERWELQHQERLGKATEIQLSDIKTVLYDENSDRYFSDEEEFVGYYTDTYFDEDLADSDLIKNIPPILWDCEEMEISIDAGSVIETACDELHEDAADNCDCASLQKVLDEWCKNQSGTTTYYPSSKRYVKVKEEWFRKEK